MGTATNMGCGASAPAEEAAPAEMGAPAEEAAASSEARLMADAAIDYYSKRNEQAFASTGKMGQLFVHYRALDADEVLSPAECETIEADVLESIMLILDWCVEDLVRHGEYRGQAEATMDEQKQKIQEMVDETRAPVSADEDGTPGKTAGEKLHAKWSEKGKNPVTKALFAKKAQELICDGRGGAARRQAPAASNYMCG